VSNNNGNFSFLKIFNNNFLFLNFLNNNLLLFFLKFGYFDFLELLVGTSIAKVKGRKKSHLNNLQ
jgi:hypothetical protein